MTLSVDVIKNNEKNKKLNGANFPMTDDGRTYHVGTKTGEVANRVVIVGDPYRAKLYATTYFDQVDSNYDKIVKDYDTSKLHFDKSDKIKNDCVKTIPKKAFEYKSARGFVTLTGTYKGVPVSVIATGMGTSMIDFSIRECRAIAEGQMSFIRVGTCGTPSSDIKAGSIVVNDKAVMIQRNPDAFRSDNNEGQQKIPYYNISKPCDSNTHIAEALEKNAKLLVGNEFVKVGMDATADSFYASQGRTTNLFEDRNELLLKDLTEKYPNLLSLEMESFHLFDMCECSKGSIIGGSALVVLAERALDTFIEPDLKKLRELQMGEVALESIISVELENQPSTNDTRFVYNHESEFQKK